MTRAAGVFAAPFTATSTVLALLWLLSSLAVPLSANEIRDRTIRSDASDCLYEQLMSFLTVRGHPRPLPGHWKCWRWPTPNLCDCAVLVRLDLIAWSSARLLANTHNTAGDSLATCCLLQSEWCAREIAAASARGSQIVASACGSQIAASARGAQHAAICANTNRTPSATSASAA